MSFQEERFTAIANAIREKDGTTAPISANDFAARILAIKAGSDFAVPLVVSTGAGALITAVNGDITIDGTADENGTAVLILTAPGEWTVTASLDGHTNGANVTVDNGYTVSISLSSRLPAGYTELEYILSDSACSINTNYMPNLNNSRIVIDMETEAWYNGSEYIFDSNYSSISGTTYQIYMRRSVSADKIDFMVGRRSGSITPGRLGMKLNIDCDCVQGKLFINGVSRLELTRTDVTMIKPLYLFAKTISSSYRSPRAKLYSAQIYTSGTLERDFVPCTNPSGVVGLYDLVNGVFYTDAGKGVLTAGPIKT